MKAPVAVTAGLALSLSLLVPYPAQAKTGFTEQHTTGSMGVRHGLALGKGVTATPWAYGFGGRLGFTLRGGVYFGLQADSYLLDRGVEHYPGREEVTIQGKVGSGTVQFGRDWGLLDRLSLRWTAGIGAAWGALRVCELQTTDEDQQESVCRSGKNPRAVFLSELALLFRVSRHVYVSGSAQWLVDTGFADHTTGGVFGVDLGWRF
jgi:hypothetical protein